MKSVSTVQSRATGLSRRGLRLLVLGGVAILPIVSMGVTIPSAVAVREHKESRAESRVRLDDRNAIARRVEAYRDSDALEQIGLINQTLRSLIPSALRPVDEFGRVREASAARGLTISSVRLARTHATSITGEGQGVQVAGAMTRYAVVIDEVVVSLSDTPEACLGLVDQLRAAGNPTVVLGFDLARTHVASHTFQTELRLGFLRRVARTNASGRTDMHTP